MKHVSTSTLLIILIFMIFFSAYFSASETSIMTLNRYRLRHKARTGNRAARRVEKLLHRTDKFLSLVLIGNNVANIFASSLATIIGMRLYGKLGVGIATGFLTFILLLFAEVLPKTIASVYPERTAFLSSVFLVPLQKIMLPIVWLLNIITKILMQMMDITLLTDSQHEPLSKEELRSIVSESRSMISSRNKDMLISVLDLDRMTVNDIMIPRNEIFAININDDWRSIIRQLTHSPHGRILLYRDHLDDAIGMLRIREAYRLMTEKQDFSKENLLRASDAIYYIPEGTMLNVQLIKFQRNKEKVGIIVDEYGYIQGLVAVEDILEEIVGDFTTSMASNISEEVIFQKDGSVIIDGSANIKKLNKIFNWSLPEKKACTINGMLLEVLQDIPNNNTYIYLNNYKINILKVQDNMIKYVKVTSIKPLKI